MNKILITGAAGFIGSKTAQTLLEQGKEVVGVDNINNYYDVRIKEYRLKQLTGQKNFKFEKIDIENIDSLDALFKREKIDGIINLAARAGVRYSMLNPFVYNTTNAGGVLNLLEMMRKYEINKFVHASTSSLYAGQKMPFSEELPVNTPISPYAATKKASEVMCYTYHYLYGLDITILRFFTVFGPAGRPDMSIFRFIKWIDEGIPLPLYGDGTQSRDFTYINDIANGAIKALKPVGYEIINLGGGNNPFSLNYMINKIEEYLGKKAKIDYFEEQKTDMKVTWADISKADKILDWKPEFGFDEGLKLTVQWYLDNKNWLKNIDCGDE